MLQLVAKRISSPEILKQNMNREGNLFYQENSHGKISRIVYFSTTRVIDFIGEVDHTLDALVRAEGHLVENIKLDEARGSLEIIQPTPS